MAWTQNFVDNFTRANSTTVGNDWSQSYDNATYLTYGIVNNALYVKGQNGATYYVRNFGVWRASTAVFSRAVQCKMITTPNSFVLWVGRRNPTTIHSTNGYGYYAFTSVFNGTGTISRMNGTTSTTLASLTGITVTAGTQYRLEHGEDGTLTFMSSTDGTNWTTHGTANDTTYMGTSDTESYGVGVSMGTSTQVARATGSFDDFKVEELLGNSYNVTYDEQGGVAVTDVVGALQFIPPTTTKSGYYFMGWNTSADGSGTSYTAGEVYVLEANLTLYAQWVTAYSVTYDEQGGSTVTDIVDQLTMTPPSSYLELYTLDHWNTVADGSGTRYEVGETATLTASLTLYAQWRKYNKVGIYLGGTTGGTDGTLEVPGDATGITLDEIGDVATVHLRAVSGYQAKPLMSAPQHCEISADGTTYATSLTLTVGTTNVPLYIKRVSASSAMNAPLSTLPHIHCLPAREVV